VYTQNIDAIEAKAGLTFGVPEFEDKRFKSKTKAKEPASATTPPSTPIRLPTPPIEVPRCIPLHGTIETLHCLSCTRSFPLSPHQQVLATGTVPECPECATSEKNRKEVGKRARGVGKLRPSVVLYNEAHREGEGVGEVVRRDLVGKRGRGASADLLLVVGTSLRVPGTKRIVREFSKAVKSRGGDSEKSSVSGLHTPSSSPAPRREADEDMVPRAIYLNLEFPVPAREFEGVFDAWLQGDAQQFAEMLDAELEKEAQAKLAAEERKRKREEEAAETQRLQDLADAEEAKKSKASKKRKTPPTPTPTPKSRKKQRIEAPKVPKRRPSPPGSCARTRKLPKPSSTLKSRRMILKAPPPLVRRSVPEVVIPIKPKRISALRPSRSPRSYAARAYLDSSSDSELTDVEELERHTLPRFDRFRIDVVSEDDPGGRL
jgi:NAD-dependent histone deacetylase SIR2